MSAPTVIDPDHYPEAECVVGWAWCPECDRRVTMIADAAAWAHEEDGVYSVTDYGPAVGECCGLLMVFGPDGDEVYELPMEGV